jgi:psiF repeat
MRMMNSVLAAAVAIVVGSAAALAQTPPAAPAAPVAPKAPMAAAPAPSVAAPSATTAAKPAVKASGANLKKPQTPEAAACSADADAKNLHGKERKKFRAACMKGKKVDAKKPN